VISVKAAPAAALRRLRDVLRIIRTPHFLLASRKWMNRYSAFAENRRRDDAKMKSAFREECSSLRIAYPSHP